MPVCRSICSAKGIGDRIVRKREIAAALNASPDFTEVILMSMKDMEFSDLTTSGEICLWLKLHYLRYQQCGHCSLPVPMECLPGWRPERLIDTNVLAVRRITNGLLPLMGQGSRIVNISSVSGLFNSPFTGAYCISKHALESMTDVYRRELMSFGIDVIAIEPGPHQNPDLGQKQGTLDCFWWSRYGTMLRNADKISRQCRKSGLPVEGYVALWSMP